ncbi:hypothetical protein AURDEDRAFT_151388 [Auricularia subglabra TFB-10046 SS5]|nr:hypothetical protein AURDEDRAFT_151388 [Auricularia subglabra TFB-10046 SS5]
MRFARIRTCTLSVGGTCSSTAYTRSVMSNATFFSTGRPAAAGVPLGRAATSRAFSQSLASSSVSRLARSQRLLQPSESQSRNMAIYPNRNPRQFDPNEPRPMLMGEMVRRVRELRSGHSLSRVLEIVLPDLPNCKGTLTPAIINSFIARDAYTVTDLDRIVNAVGVQANGINWSTVINNAIRCSGLQAALAVYTEATQRGVRISTSVADQLIGALVNPRNFYLPDPPSIQRAVSIFLQQISTEDPTDESYIDALPLLQTLLRSTAVSDRHTHVGHILDWMAANQHPLDRAAPHLDSVIDACLRCRSYDAAVSAISQRADLSSVDLKRLLGMIVRIRFDGPPFMPMADLTAFLRHFESCGHEVDGSVFTTYLHGLRDELLYFTMPWETGAFEKSGRTAADAQKTLWEHVRAFDAFVSQRYPASANGHVYTALLSIIPTLHVGDEQFFVRLWGVVNATMRPISQQAVSAALDAAPRGQLSRVWADYCDSVSTPSVDACTSYVRALVYEAARQEEAFRVIKQYIGDDPENANAAIALFALAPSPEALRRYTVALPRTWSSPKVQESLARYREHRIRLGLPVSSA